MIIQPDIEAYLNKMVSRPPSVVEEMEQYAAQKRFPIAGPLVGKFLQLMVRTSRAKNILECGGGFGYSAVWMAEVLPDDGKIVSIDYSEDNAARGTAYLKKAGHSKKVQFLSGDVMALLPQMNEWYDLIFNDVDNHFYPELLPLILPKLKPGGMLITDNVLWRAKVVGENPDNTTRAVLQYNEMLHQSPELETSILPLRDGLAISIKQLHAKD
ncbi:MAG: O-methyltransferase [Calditrichia bacterium]